MSVCFPLFFYSPFWKEKEAWGVERGVEGVTERDTAEEEERREPRALRLENAPKDTQGWLQTWEGTSKECQERQGRRDG